MNQLLYDKNSVRIGIEFLLTIMDNIEDKTQYVHAQRELDEQVNIYLNILKKINILKYVHNDDEERYLFIKDELNFLMFIFNIS